MREIERLESQFKVCQHRWTVTRERVAVRENGYDISMTVRVVCVRCGRIGLGEFQLLGVDEIDEVV